MLSKPAETKEGFEMTLGANHLGTFLLTSLLIDRLREAGNARVVTVGSIAHRGATGVQESDFSVPENYKGMGADSQSKLANILFARELAKRETEAGRHGTALAVHPGRVRRRFGPG